MVAERAGVSTATVSRALSDPHRVQSKTRARVQEAIDALGYAPNFAAKSLRTLRTRKIIVMIPDVSNPFFAEVLRGAEDAAEDAGYSVLRMWNVDVLKEIDAVCAAILAAPEGRLSEDTVAVDMRFVFVPSAGRER